MARSIDPGDYDAVADPYCYPGTAVLGNIPDLHDAGALAAFEAASTAQRADEPLPNGRFGFRHCQAIHKRLFQDVYSWAGKFRRVRLGKGGSAFCYPENIRREMDVLFADLKRKRHLEGLAPDALAGAAAHFLATLNAIHPFREGNGRAQTTLLVLLADHARHPVNLDALVPERFLSAMIESFHGNETHLAEEIRRIIV
jgi:cell filamentation protein